MSPSNLGSPKQTQSYYLCFIGLFLVNKLIICFYTYVIKLVFKWSWPNIMVWFHWLFIFSSFAMRSPKFLWAIWSQTQSCSRSFRTSEVVFTMCVRIIFIAWENSRHFAMQLLFSLQNDVWGTSAEVLYWWLVTTLIWVVLLIGHAAREICFNQSEVLPRSG